MNLKGAIIETFYRNGRSILSVTGNYNAARLTVLPFLLDPVSNEARSLMMLSFGSSGPKAIQQFPSHECSRKNSVTNFSLYTCWNGLGDQYVRTSTTQASPATYVSEGDKPKANINKTQVLFEELSTVVTSGKVTLVDVREPDEVQKTGGIPGSINIPLTKLKAALVLSDEEFVAAYNRPKLQKDDSNIIFYGLSSVKSSAALEIAHKAGFKKSRYYPGGMEEWTQKHPKS